MAAQNAIAKQANALVTLFIQCYEKKYGRKPQVNRYREKWGFQDMITDLGYSESREVVEYYFRTEKSGHPVNFLLQNYDRINTVLTERKQDEEKRAELRRLTEQRVKEWEAKNG